MKRFILKSLLYSVPVLLAHLWIARYADGITDAYYLRFTTPPQHSMILGTSKAAQGLRPDVINPALGLEAGKEVFNYAFTLNHSPYGSIYRKSIAKKLDPKTRDGIFILEVDAWSLSGKAKDPEDSTIFKEKDGELGRTHFVNMDPNYEYLIDNYPHGWFKLAWKKWKPSPSVHELHIDGWLEINTEMDSASVAERTKRKIAEYKKNPKVFTPSKLRQRELAKTIDFLKEHGQVFLLRMPVCSDLADIESDYMPSFLPTIDSLRRVHDVPFWDMRQLPDTFRYVDGNHLYFESGKSVSKLVADYIREFR